MAQQRTYTQTDAVQYLIVNHIDRISQGITGLNPSESNLDKITNLWLDVRMLQVLLTLVYDKKYMDEKEKLKLPEAQKKVFLKPTMENILEFADKICLWFELLVICCNESDILMLSKKAMHRKNPFDYDK